MDNSAVVGTAERLAKGRAALPIEDIKNQITYLGNELLPVVQTLFDETQSPHAYEMLTKLHRSRTALFHTLRFLDNASSCTGEWISYALGGNNNVVDNNEKAQPSPGKLLSVIARVNKYLDLLEHPWPRCKQLLGWRIEVGQEKDVPISSGKKDFDNSFKDCEAYTVAEKRIRELGILGDGDSLSQLTGHIEVMEASSMKPGEKRIIVIGKRPCGWQHPRNFTGKRRCHQFLEYILPPGATLIVYAKGDKKLNYSRFIYKGKTQ